MRIAGRHYRSIALSADRSAVEVIDQTLLPFRFAIARWETVADVAHGIRTMVVRGAPLIGASAAYGVALALSAEDSEAALTAAIAELGATRPTAVNLRWALERMERTLDTLSPGMRVMAAFAEAGRIADEDVTLCSAIGDHGLGIISRIASEKPHKTLNILTHCNAGWLATVDWGTALAPVYKAHDAGLPVHVWVDETRPRNQGAFLTAYELNAHGVPHTVIADNAGGHLMQHGQVDLVITGADRVTASGDAANKIGTYLKALAARDCGVPFYVAVPSPTIDWRLDDGVRDIPIEERSASEVTSVAGPDADGTIRTVRIVSPGSPAANPAFDVTPARLITGLITERGIAPASRAGLAAMFPDLAGRS
jgi:methylthioribose-1-phosphate isomerase